MQTAFLYSCLAWPYSISPAVPMLWLLASVEEVTTTVEPTTKAAGGWLFGGGDTDDDKPKKEEGSGYNTSFLNMRVQLQ